MTSNNDPVLTAQPVEINSNESYSLDGVLEELENWRANKQSASEPIPETLWVKIVTLAQQHSNNAVCKLFRLRNDQLKRKMAALLKSSASDLSKKTSTVDDISTIQLASVNVVKKPYQPDPLPLAKDTIIAEFQHANGQVLKIHTTTERLYDLIQHFYAQP